MRNFILIAGMILALAAQAAERGRPAPLFKADPLLGNEAIELESYRGKVLIVDFWASWCKPCRKSMPAFEQLRGEYGPAGFEVIAVNVDEVPQDALDFLEKYPVTYPTARDSEGRLAKLYDVRAMPMSYLVDRKGVVRHVHAGFNEKDLPALRAAVAELVAEE